MENDLINQILEFIHTSGDVVLTKGYEILSKQVVVNAIGNAIMVLIGVGLVVLGWKLVHKVNMDNLDTSLFLFGLIPLIIGPFFILFSIFPIVNTILNPDWMVLDLILHSLGK
jgi:hypothetical protein